MNVWAAIHQGPRPGGMERHLAPFSCRQRIASTVRRRSEGGVLPLGRHSSTNGPSAAHCPSVSIASSPLAKKQRPQALTGPRCGARGARARHAGILRAGLLRDDGSGPAGLDVVEDGAGVMGSVGDDVLGGKAVHRRQGLRGAVFWPAVGMKCNGRPWVSTATGHLLVSPPRERPRAWSAQSPF